MAEKGVGHRQRLKERFNAGAPRALSDVALLELLLTYAIPRADVQPLAQALLSQFGSLDSVLSAQAPALRQVTGLGDAAITLLKLTRHIACAGVADGVKAAGIVESALPGGLPNAEEELVPVTPDLHARTAAAPDTASSTAAPALITTYPGAALRTAASIATPGDEADSPLPKLPNEDRTPTRWRASGRYLASNMLKPGLVPEIALALHTYGRVGEWPATRRYLQDEGLPQRSRASRTTVANVFRDRLLTWNPPAWVLHDLVRAANESSHQDLRLLLLLHTARQDVLLYELVQHVIAPRWREGITQIGYNDVQAFLDQAAPEHPEIDRWTRETRSKLAGNVLTVLRDYGLLAGTLPKHIVEPVVTPFAASHLERLLREEGVPEEQAARHPDWTLWLLEPARVQDLLEKLHPQEGVGT